MTQYTPVPVPGSTPVTQLALGEQELFTVISAIVDPRRGRVAWASGGHPPPLVRAGNGTTRYLEVRVRDDALARGHGRWRPASRGGAAVIPARLRHRRPCRGAFLWSCAITPHLTFTNAGHPRLIGKGA